MNKAVNRHQSLLRHRPPPSAGSHRGRLSLLNPEGNLPVWGSESVAPGESQHPFCFSNLNSIFTLVTVTWCCGFRDCEPVAKVSSENRGSALGVSTAFVDVSLGVSGPVAGIVVSRMGYPLIFLFAAAMAGVSVILILLVRVLDARSGYGNHDDDNRVDPKHAANPVAGRRKFEESRALLLSMRTYRFMIDPAPLLKG